MGRWDEAWTEVNRAHETDPFSRAISANIGLRLFEARRFDQAIAQYKRVIESDPNYPVVHSLLGRAYDAKGMYPEAIAENRTAVILMEKESAESADQKAAAFIEALGTGGVNGYWRKHLEICLSEYDQGYESAFAVAIIYARLGDGDNTFTWLEKSFAAHEQRLNYMKAEPALDGVSSDPRFADMLKRVGLPE